MRPTDTQSERRTGTLKSFVAPEPREPLEQVADALGRAEVPPLLNPPPVGEEARTPFDRLSTGFDKLRANDGTGLFRQSLGCEGIRHSGRKSRNPVLAGHRGRVPRHGARQPFVLSQARVRFQQWSCLRSRLRQQVAVV